MRTTGQHFRALLRIVAAVLFVWAGQAHALLPVVTGTQYKISDASGWHESREASCDAFWATFNGVYPEGGNGVEWEYAGVGAHIPNGTGTWCRVRYRSATGGWQSWLNMGWSTRNGSWCPANSTSVSGGCQCNSGYNESGGSCVTDQCNATLGTTKIVNWTVGWLRTPDDTDYSFVGGGPNLPGGSGQVCSGGCTYGVGAPVAAWRSQVPNAQGLYRGSVDFESTGLGTACTAASDSPESPTAPEPACPGYVGEVNGRLGCYGTAQKPIQPVNVPGATETPRAGNPAAGEKPASGEGSGSDGAGRTPTNGSGGNAGGPSGAAQGGKGGGAGGASNGKGTTSKPGEGEEQQNCGAPGQPVCAVKVDETGVPKTVSNAEQYGTAVDAHKDAQKEQINGAGNTAKGWFSGWGFGFSLPSGCNALVLDGYSMSIDFCRWQSMIHDIMSLVWLSVTAWACIGMVGRTFRGGS